MLQKRKWEKTSWIPVKARAHKAKRDTWLSMSSNNLIALEVRGFEIGQCSHYTFLILQEEEHKTASAPNRNII